MHTKRIAFLVLVVVSLWAVSASAQVDSATATLKGTIKDQHEAVIAGATVTATSVDRGVSKSATTGTDGTYQIPLLQPGAYRVQVEAQGFNKAVADGIGLTVGQSLVYDVQLGPGGVTANVSVTGDSPLIQVEQTQQANTINQSQVENLPNINRTMTAAVFTLPGVSSSDATRSQQPGYTGFGTTGFSIGGSNGRNNLSTIDGGENEYGTGAYRVFIPVDAIQEYQVNRSSFAAEFGFTVGSSVNIVTKSGTNKFHGTVYGYYRDDRTSANNFIDQIRGSTHLLRGKTTTELYSQHFISGGTVGGPIKKDKLFFFTSYEFVKDDLGAFNFLSNSPNVRSVTSSQQSYINLLAGSGSATLVGIANQWQTSLVPQNNANLSTLLARDNGAYNSATKVHTLLSRIDYQPNANNSWNFRFELSHGLNGAQSFPSGARLITRDYSILTNWAHTFGASVVNQLRVQIVPLSRADNPTNAALAAKAPNGSIADPAVAAMVPASITISGFGIGGFVPDFTFGSPAQIPYLANQRRYQFEDTVAWVKGHHNFKVGASYRPVSYNVEDDLYFAGQFSFNDFTYPLILAGLTPTQQGALGGYNATHTILGATGCSGTTGPNACIPTNGPTATNLTGPQSFTFSLPTSLHQGFNNPTWHGTAHYFGSFVQDSWRVSPKLTLDLGGRFDFDAEPPPLVHRSYFSPRLGFAWTPFGDQKTVIRGGAGVFEGPIDVLIPSYRSILDDTGRYINQILPVGSTGATSAVALYRAAVAAGLLPFGHVPASFYNGLGQATGPGANNRVVFNADPNYKNPYSIQASLSVQRQIAKNLSLEVGYLMYHGLHLQMPVESNFKETGVVDPFLGPLYTALDKPACTTTTPLPTCLLSNVSYKSIGKSIYHAMTVSLNKRYSNGLQFGANYTWSKTLDDVLDFSSSQAFFRPTRLNLYRGISAYDFPHLFSVNAVYTSPFKAGPGHNVISRMLADFTVAPVLTLRSGIPFSIRLPAISGTGIATTDRNFATPFAAGRNTSRGEPYKSLDLLIRKSLYLNRDRGLRFDLSVEGTNILNRRNFNKVWDQFDTLNPYSSTGFLGNPGANPVVTFANGTTGNLLTGPFNFKGFVPTSAAQLQNVPLAFVGTDSARRVSVGLRVSF